MEIALQEGLHCPLVEVFNPTNIMKEILSYYLFFLGGDLNDYNGALG
jgi:hypothetical protein